MQSVSSGSGQMLDMNDFTLAEVNDAIDLEKTQEIVRKERWASTAIELLNKRRTKRKLSDAPELRKMLLRKSPYHFSTPKQSAKSNPNANRRLSADSVLLKQIELSSLRGRKLSQPEPDKLLLSQEELKQNAALSDSLGALSYFVSQTGSEELCAIQKASLTSAASKSSLPTATSFSSISGDHNQNNNYFSGEKHSWSWPRLQTQSTSSDKMILELPEFHSELMFPEEYSSYYCDGYY